MSKLTDFYAHKAAINGQDPRWEQMEDHLLKEEMLPELIEHLKAVLSKVKSPLMFSGYYDPNGGLSVSFTRNCLQISTQSPMQAAVQQEEEETSDEVDRLREVVSMMTEKQQRVYELHFLEGYSLTEVAAIMGTSIPSIHKHKEKILKFIKENFKRG